MRHQKIVYRLSFGVATQLILLALSSCFFSTAIAQIAHERAIKHDITFSDYSPAMQKKILEQEEKQAENLRITNTRDANRKMRSNDSKYTQNSKTKIDYVIIPDRVIAKRRPESDDVTGVFRKGSKVNIYEESGSWVQISPSDNKQWIEKNTITQYKRMQ